MDTEGKVAAIHSVAGIVAGYISFILSKGAIESTQQNVIAVVAALIILYIVGQLSEKLFGKEEVGRFNGWLWSGIVPFFFIWILVWVVFINLK